jgi:VWFA-related protein
MHKSLDALWAALLAVGLLAMVLSARAQDTSSDQTIKVATRLVSVPVIVSDRNDRYIPNLTSADFSILQDGSAQNIEFFGATEEPLTIALLIDTSQSTRDVLGDIRDSARSLVKLLGPHDRAIIVSFDYDTHTLSPLTSDHDELNRAIKKAEVPEFVGTTLRDAAFQTITKTFAPLKGRKAIILLTDGKDAGSRVTSQELLYALQETDTLIYTIMFKTDERAAGRNGYPGGGIFGGRFPGRGRFPGGRFPRGNDRRDDRRTERVELENEAAGAFLQKLSEVTAGRFYSSKNGKLKNIFATIVEELRFQYRLGFYPPEETGGKQLHEIRIKVDRPETVVRSRGTYRVQSTAN